MRPALYQVAMEAQQKASFLLVLSKVISFCLSLSLTYPPSLSDSHSPAHTMLFSVSCCPVPLVEPQIRVEAVFWTCCGAKHESCLALCVPNAYFPAHQLALKSAEFSPEGLHCYQHPPTPTPTPLICMSNILIFQAGLSFIWLYY